MVLVHLESVEKIMLKFYYDFGEIFKKLQENFGEIYRKFEKIVKKVYPWENDDDFMKKF